jgi:hypothetical protein
MSKGKPVLTVRREQIAVFEKQRLEDFTHRLRLGLAEACAAAGQAPAAGWIGRQVNSGVALAREWGLTRECDVARLVLLVCVRCGGFDAALPRPLEILARAQGVDPEVRLRNMEDWISAAENERRRMLG